MTNTTPTCWIGLPRYIMDLLWHYNEHVMLIRAASMTCHVTTSVPCHLFWLPYVNYNIIATWINNKFNLNKRLKINEVHRILLSTCTTIITLKTLSTRYDLIILYLVSPWGPLLSLLEVLNFEQFSHI